MGNQKAKIIIMGFSAGAAGFLLPYITSKGMTITGIVSAIMVVTKWATGKQLCSEGLLPVITADRKDIVGLLIKLLFDVTFVVFVSMLFYRVNIRNAILNHIGQVLQIPTSVRLSASVIMLGVLSFPFFNRLHSFIHRFWSQIITKTVKEKSGRIALRFLVITVVILCQYYSLEVSANSLPLLGYPGGLAVFVCNYCLLLFVEIILAVVLYVSSLSTVHPSKVCTS